MSKSINPRAYDAERTRAYVESEAIGLISCSRCHIEQPTRNFYRSPKRRGSRKFSNYCKPCKRNSYKNWRGMNPARVKWQMLMRRASARGLAVMGLPEFGLWWNAQAKSCVYCGLGAAISEVMFKRGIGVDRMDNSKGYITGNIALACHRCNTVKSSHLTHDQMMTVASMFFRAGAAS